MKPISKFSIVLTLLLTGTLFVTGIAFSGQNGQGTNPPALPTPGFGYNIFLPILQRHNTLTYGISGQVTDASSKPVAWVVVADNAGHSTFTDDSGNYTLTGLVAGNYALAPAKDGYVFSPSVQSITLPAGGESGLDFTALTSCTEAILNGGFESDSTWQFPETPYTAGYSTAQKYTGSRSVRTGIVSDSNVYSYSSARQLINIPTGTSSATLRLYLYPVSGEAINAPIPKAPEGPNFGEAVEMYDAQYVLVLDPGANPELPDDDTLLETLYWTRTNNQTWEYKEFSLTKYAGRTIKIQVGTYNDGWGGLTAMYVDDVSVEVCPSSGATATPTVTPTPTACYNQISNSGFEYTGSWDIPVTEYPAGYTSDQHYLGSKSMRTGIPNVAWNKYSYSDAGQWISIPSNATSATLKMRFYPMSGETAEKALPEIPRGQRFGESPLSSDAQYVLIIDQSYYWTAVYWNRTNTQSWTTFETSLLAWKGQTIKVQFGTYNDGYDGVTAMYVDEVYLDTCTTTAPTSTPTPTPTQTATPVNTPTPTATLPPGTATPTPVGCYEGVVNGSFESQYAWEIPITEFSAGYSSDQRHAGYWSMRTGITYSGWNRFSYSDARQPISIAAGTKSALLRMWIYPISGETAESLPSGIPTRRQFGDEVLSGDVQYVLILDKNYYWVDTALWQRSNSQAWTFVTYDLTNYIGDTINLQFGTYNDGSSGVTSMYVDDVSVQICP